MKYRMRKMLKLAFYNKTNLSAIWQVRNLLMQVTKKPDTVVNVGDIRRVRRSSLGKNKRYAESNTFTWTMNQPSRRGGFLVRFSEPFLAFLAVFGQHQELL